jgi:hypothetical protein
MEESEIKQTTEKILSIKNEKEVLKNLKRYGDFLAEKGIVACEIITDIIYKDDREQADQRFLSFSSGYSSGAAVRLRKVLVDMGSNQ